MTGGQSVRRRERDRNVKKQSIYSGNVNVFVVKRTQNLGKKMGCASSAPLVEQGKHLVETVNDTVTKGEKVLESKSHQI